MICCNAQVDIVMKLKFYGLAIVLWATAPCLAVAQSGNCVDADPSSVLSGITGDFELSIDPQDGAQHVIFTSNVTSSSKAIQNVVVAQLDGQTGMVVAGTLTTVADNFRGNSRQNGPTWMYTPQAQLGIIYKGADGVHGVYRSPQPASWNDFSYNYDGSLASGSPLALPTTTRAAYPGNGPNAPTEAATYAQYLGHCTSLCYAAYNTGLATDVAIALQPYGYTDLTSTQAVKDGSLYISACSSTVPCGLFQAKIDGAGGFSSFLRIASIDKNEGTRLAAAQHPVTGTTVIFTNGHGNTIDVWQQLGDGAALQLLGEVSVPSDADHYRAAAGSTLVVLNYLVRSGDSQGNYTIPISANGSTLVVGSSTLISSVASGAEFDWFPAADQWGLFYQKVKLKSGGGDTSPQVPANKQEYVRCWITP